ncbi:ABC transporter ATP-binding protein [Actinomadura madurae]|uniref:ABC transporter ATP-binding protein n=1 Tax=Actinomadura madurae TaxID=1993 RepID=UPI0020D240DA|nr:ABC transporter ATP-binding protein [Actinomadura madurae]MCP9950881.1 ABC transporter ATP-binding protein [Actinomadura madurae]MCP9980115.1 ABC transporter ATP-binding protein [Actinomadura madurae]MCQ0016329.1 ABC transporter ATP-binding protein [Actinomadura madurae]
MTRPDTMDGGRAGAATSEPPMLRLANVTKRYGDAVAADGVTLELAPGEFVSLLGESGSGKSTALKLVAGFETPDEGSVHIGGRDVSGLPPARRDLGMVFQQYALFPYQTVARNIEYGLRRRKWDRDARRRRVAELLDLVRMTPYAERYPAQLSGGQQQRVALARAIAPLPGLLLMDEPLSALDRTLRLDLQDEIRAVHRSTGAGVVYVTHDREEALSLSDRIVVLRHGRIDAAGSPSALFRRPRTAYVARLISDANILPCELEASAAPKKGRVRVRLHGRTAAVPAGDDLPEGADLAVAVPRTAITLKASAGDPVPEGGDMFDMPVRLEDRVYLGDTVRLLLRLDDATMVTAHRPEGTGPVPPVGERMTARIALGECSVVTR